MESTRAIQLIISDSRRGKGDGWMDVAVKDVSGGPTPRRQLGGSRMDSALRSIPPFIQSKANLGWNRYQVIKGSALKQLDRYLTQEVSR